MKNISFREFVPPHFRPVASAIDRWTKRLENNPGNARTNNTRLSMFRVKACIAHGNIVRKTTPRVAERKNPYSRSFPRFFASKRSCSSPFRRRWKAFLKFNMSLAGIPTSPGRHPPENEPLRPMAAGPGYHGNSFAWQVAATTTTSATTVAGLPSLCRAAPAPPYSSVARPFCLPPLRRTNRT